ncbi:MAG: transposase [Isosphaeraceae bacterium]
MRANQIHLFFSSIAYTLLDALRRLGLTETSMARAQCRTIRIKTVEDRCLGASDCAESLGAIGQQLPLR